MVDVSMVSCRSLVGFFLIVGEIAKEIQTVQAIPINDFARSITTKLLIDDYNIFEDLLNPFNPILRHVWHARDWIESEELERYCLSPPTVRSGWNEV